MDIGRIIREEIGDFDWVKDNEFNYMKNIFWMLCKNFSLKFLVKSDKREQKFYSYCGL